jgi:tetratricopeptide (TPR) repeat protein
LFPDAVPGLPALTSSRDQGSALNALAQSYQLSGQPARSVPLFRRVCEIDNRLGDARSRQVHLSNLGYALYSIGALREAIGALLQALVLNRELEDVFNEDVILNNLGPALNSTDAHDLGLVALSRGRAISMGTQNPQLEGVASAQLAELALWLGDLAAARTWAELAWDLAAVHKVERDFIRAAFLQGRVALAAGDLPRADERLYHGLTRARAVNVVEFELPALIAIADLELQRGHPAEAKIRLNEVWEATERGPYPLHQTDAFNLLAAIELTEGDRPAAIEAATNAFKSAWRDGSPYAYHWGLEKAKAQLVALGASEPMPEVEINPKDEYCVDPDSLD